jgi:hypothetical protein
MYRINKNSGVSITLDVFKTLVKLKVVDPIVNPAKWTRWFGVVKEFVRKYEC